MFNLLAVLSLMLVVTTVVLWMRSYQTPRSFMFFSGERFQFSSVNGRCGVLLLSSPTSGSSPMGGSTGMESRFVHRNFVFSNTATDIYPDSHTVLHGHFVYMQYWAVLLVDIAILSFFLWRAFAHHRLRYRLIHGLCSYCGYDLRTTPGRCPECGTVPKAAAVG